MASKKRGKNAVDTTNEELRSKIRKIKNPNNNNRVAAIVEQVPNVQQQEPPIQDFGAELLKETRCTNQLLTCISKQLDVIVGELLKEKSNENDDEEREDYGCLAL